jgi:hypothetical protein
MEQYCVWGCYLHVETERCGLDKSLGEGPSGNMWDEFGYGAYNDTRPLRIQSVTIYLRDNIYNLIIHRKRTSHGAHDVFVLRLKLAQTTETRTPIALY